MGALGAAIIGTGFIGPVHLEALRRLGIPVAGILGSTPEKSVAAAEALGLPRGYASLDELLADDAVDVVHVTSPNRLHHAQAAAALAAGKHVMCEKPLAMTSAESGDLVQRAAAAGCHAGVCYNVRYYPHCLEAAERVRQGYLGDIRAVVGAVQQDWLLRPTDYNWRVLAEQGGELRAVADIGTHWMDLVSSIVGQRIVGVLADLWTVHPTRYRPVGEVQTFSREQAAETEPVAITTDDCGSLLLRFESGIPGNLWVSQVTPGRKYQVRFEIIGSERTLAWQSERPDELWIGSREEGNRLLLRDPGSMGKRAAHLSNYPAGHAEGYPDSFKQLFRDFYDAIQGGVAPAEAKYPTFADGHGEILIVDAALKSRTDGGWVVLTT